MDDADRFDFEKQRREAGLSVSALSDLSGIPRTTLKRKLLNPGTLTLNEAAALHAALAGERVA